MRTPLSSPRPLFPSEGNRVRPLPFLLLAPKLASNFQGSLPLENLAPRSFQGVSPLNFVPLKSIKEFQILISIRYSILSNRMEPPSFACMLFLGCFTSRGDTGGSPKRPGSLGCEPTFRINVRLLVTELGVRDLFPIPRFGIYFWHLLLRNWFVKTAVHL